jgi:MoaA/NifB/PqqE/SkfB family radical SAM enzyme
MEPTTSLAHPTVQALVADWRSGRRASVCQKLSRLETADFLRKPGDIVERLDVQNAVALLSQFADCLADSGEADDFVEQILIENPKCRHAFLFQARRKMAAAAPMDAINLIKSALAVYSADTFAQKMLFDVYKMLPADQRPADAGFSEINLKGRICVKPFYHFETTSNGDVYVCCPSDLPTPIGNVHSASWEEIWNSPTAKELRRSILDGDYSHCSKVSCTAIQANSLPTVDALLDLKRHQAAKGDPSAAKLAEAIGTREITLSFGPTFVNLSHDQSCNLSCPSCRKEIIITKKSEQEKLDAILEPVVFPVLRQARYVWITGSGDPFGSKHFRDILQRLNPAEYPELTVDLQTNGQLFTAGEWAKLEKIHSMVGEVYISIDAARPATYSKVRRPGDFSRIVENLEFIADLRRKGNIRRLVIAFVVQAANYKEMPEFVELGRKWNVDAISFSRIRQWGAYSPEEFRALDIFDPMHAEHKAFLAVLQTPSLKERFVSLNNLSSFS